ncbi:response regulator [Candidatus Ferrigenium straubiae]|jgi:DNA-binding NarL/FixJ family response regulator|uniref:response regulator n=1 Tax=Candidatus Ferrigenium straubiae TaxID=2919506 RepID=UPI003F4A8D75
MMKEKKRVLIVEDHTLLRAGLKALLSQDTEIEIVGEAENGRDAVRMIATTAPDLVLTDLSMPGMNGIESIVDIKRRYPGVRVLVLTIHKTDEYIFEAMRAGADGYILKDASHDELRIAIRSVLNGKTYLSPDISAKVINGYLDTDKSSSPVSTWDTLTHREREVLKLVAEGHPNKFIADYFCLSIKTVEKHRSNLMKKLNLHNASMITAYAIERGLVTN